jgi:hypothetical protein
MRVGGNASHRTGSLLAMDPGVSLVPETADGQQQAEHCDAK